MSTVRLRRLQADYDRLRDYVRRHPRLQLIQADGEPPERYQIEYRVRGLRQRDDELLEVESHLVEIALPLGYPRTPPQCRMLTPVFHPNIAPHAICIGDHWSPGESLAALAVRIGELLTYQSYNTKSPLNGEAARWVTDHIDELPLDPVSLVLEDSGPLPPAPPTPRPAAAPAPHPRPAPEPDAGSPPRIRQSSEPTDDKIALICPNPDCSAKLRLPRSAAGRKIRCPKCQTIATAPG